MKKARKVLLSQIFDQLRMLRGTISALETLHESEFFCLSGQQTVDVDAAVHLAFRKLQDQLAEMEETLATIAEATGVIPKL